MDSIRSGFVEIEWHDHRADVFIARPDKRNAMTLEVMRDLTEAFRTAADRDGIRAITLLGRGSVFSAGMDLDMMRDRADGESQVQDVLAELFNTIERIDQPVVAGIKAAAPAGAFELTLPCDFRVLGEDANYGLLEVKLGTFPHGGGTQRLPRLVGLSKAKEIVLTGEWIEPEEAKQCGLVHEVCAPEDVDERAIAFADRLTENAPLALGKAKEMLNAALDLPLSEGLKYETAMGEQLDDTYDYREGFEARLEGRDPEFRGE